VSPKTGPYSVGRFAACAHCQGRNPDVWEGITFPNETVANELKSYIAGRLKPQPVKVRTEVEVTCFEYEGIDAIKRALYKAEEKNTPENSVKVRLVASPAYVMTSTCLDKNAGLKRLEEAIDEVRKSIASEGGSLVVKMAPKLVSERDDAELAALMEKRARENAEVSGDDSESHSDEGIPDPSLKD